MPHTTLSGRLVLDTALSGRGLPGHCPIWAGFGRFGLYGTLPSLGGVQITSACRTIPYDPISGRGLDNICMPNTTLSGRGLDNIRMPNTARSQARRGVDNLNISTQTSKMFNN